MVIFQIPEAEQLWPAINRASDVRWVVIPDASTPGRFMLVEESLADTYLEHMGAGDNASLDEAVPSSYVCPPDWLYERPTISQFADGEIELPEWVANDPVAAEYLEMFGELDWDNFPERDLNRLWPGPVPNLRRTYAAAFMVKIMENRRYMGDLRNYLVKHPALVWLLGFRLLPDSESRYGFDVEGSVPTSRHFGRVLRNFPNSALQYLLTNTVHLIGAQLPDDVDFGVAISGDTKHILAWVKENNPKQFVKERYDKEKQPVGDPDCKLGVKRRHNRKKSAADLNDPSEQDENQTQEATLSESARQQPSQPSESAHLIDASAIPVVESLSTNADHASQADKGSTQEPKDSITPTTYPVPRSSVKIGAEMYWGYGSGVIATKVPDWGEFVLAEHTQTFNRSDISYFFPLMEQVYERLSFRPLFGAFDPAFDAHYVYQYFHDAGGFAAVPFVKKGGYTREFDESGLPLCEAGLGMPLRSDYMCGTSLIPHLRGRYVCPLLYPEVTGKSCPINHPKFADKGCATTMATDQGSRIRYELDRKSDQYKDLYKQRTATERINSRAKELGIERPMLRNQKSITNLNTVIYIAINLRGLHSIKNKKQNMALGT